MEKLKIEFPCDQTIPLWDIYPKNLKVGFRKAICTLIFTEELFTMSIYNRHVESGKQPKCAVMDE